MDSEKTQEVQNIPSNENEPYDPNLMAEILKHNKKAQEAMEKAK